MAGARDSEIFPGTIYGRTVQEGSQKFSEISCQPFKVLSCAQFSHCRDCSSNLCDCWLLGYHLHLEQFPPVASKPRLHTVVFFQKLQNTCCFQNTRVFTCKLRPKLRLPGPPFATPTRKEGVSATLQSSCVSCVQGKKAFMSWQQIPARSWWWMDMMETQDTMKRIAHTQIYTYFDSCIYNYMHLRGHGCRHVSIKHVYCTETFSLNMRIGAPIVLHIVWFHIHTPLLPCTFAQFGTGEAAPTWCNQVKSQTITSAEAPILECIP